MKAPIDYRSAVSGAIRLVPVGAGLARLEDDYEQMVADGLLWGDAEPFGGLMGRCQEIETMLNHR